MKTIRKGFTLIELLIVVAIIATLAAIAIPNFLNAQVRAKISKTKGQLQTLATALEAYCVDNGDYPNGFVLVPPPTDGQPNIGNNTPDFLSAYNIRLIPLTTPIPYISTLPIDPFNPGGERSAQDWSDDGNNTYIYYTNKPADILRLHGTGVFPKPGWVYEYPSAVWRLAGYGPGRKRYWGGTNFIREGQMGHPNYEYDPTNGTISNGMVTRVGP